MRRPQKEPNENLLQQLPQRRLTWWRQRHAQRRKHLFPYLAERSFQLGDYVSRFFDIRRRMPDRMADRQGISRILRGQQ